MWKEIWEKEHIDLNLPALENISAGWATEMGGLLYPFICRWAFRRNPFLKNKNLTFQSPAEKTSSVRLTLPRAKSCAPILCGGGGGAPLCHHHIHSSWEASRRALIVLASRVPKPKCWVFSWASIRESEDLSEGSVMGEWCRISSHCGWAWSGHTTVETSPASYFIVCWSDGDSYREVCLSQTGRSCVFKGKFC